MRKQDLHDQALRAIVESIMSHTVAIILGDTGLATGVVIGAKGQSYIVTARHVLEDVPENKLEFIFRPPGTFQMIPRLADVRRMIGRRSVTLPIECRILSAEQDDLAFLGISSEVIREHDVRPYGFGEGHSSPLMGEEVLVAGFPRDLIRSATSIIAREQARAALPTVFVTNVVGGPAPMQDFYPESHFHLAFGCPLDDAQEFKQPYGLSGGGVWIPPPLPRVDQIWSPSSIKLAGIQVSWFKRRGLLKAVRIERVTALLSTVTP